ncbi:MAG: carboxypeptidase-like regulatory domain-containing protein [Bacteroidota bacterium]
MKQKIQLHIPEPCHENWNDMTGTEQGRFCMSCQKQVIDFSTMTDKEILHYISTASSNTCGRVGIDQINRDLVIPAIQKRIWWKYWMGVAASLVMLSSKADAQTSKNKPVITCQPLPIRMGTVAYVQKENKGRIELHGRVIDDNGNPVAYASVSLNGTRAGAAADSAGFFKLLINPNMAGLKIMASSVGYKTKNVEIDSIANKEWATNENDARVLQLGDIILESSLMDDIIISGLPSQLICVTAGGIEVRRRYTRYEKVKNIVKQVVNLNEIKIYPNPVSVNSQFKINFNIKEYGEYAVQFIDISGKIIYGRQLNIPSKNHTESFSANMFLTNGVYIVNVTGRQNGKNYATKLLVQ